MKTKKWRIIPVVALALIAGILTVAPAYAAEENKESATTTESTSDSAQDTSVKPSIAFYQTPKSIKAGKTYRYTVVRTGVEGDVEYSVSDIKLATISANGVVKAKKVGTVTITAKVADLTISTKLKIKGKKIICLDPGHSSVVASGSEPIGPGSSTMKAKDNSGCVGVASHVPEYKYTLNIAKQLKKKLESKGYAVVMTRTNNKQPRSCSERAKIATKAKADVFLRLHVDSINSSSVTGASSHYPTSHNPYLSKSICKKSKKLSQCVLKAMCKESGAKCRGNCARDDLSGSNWATMPVTLIEVGFMSNPGEDMKLQNKDYQKKLVNGMAKGLDKYFGYKK